MSKKDKSKISIRFCGGNSYDVTGSCIYIETPHRKILLECGLWQSCGSTLENWKINTRKYDFKARDIDYLFIGHVHADHLCGTPLLYNRGAHCEIIAPTGSYRLAEILMRDSCHIVSSDAEELTKKFGRNYEPFCVAEDVDNAMAHWTEYDSEEIIELDEYIKFRFVPSGHIIGACQIELWITDGSATKKILYTSDLGNKHIPKPYVEPFKPVEKANVMIMETTYAGEQKIADMKMREKDIEKLRTAIDQTCIDLGRRVLIPSFALARTQEILTVLYDLYGNDPEFTVPIYVDSPMAANVCSAYSEILQGADYDKWMAVMHWKNVRFVGDYLESRALRDSGTPCIVVASSGFLVAGRSVAWVASLLPNVNDRVITIGYAPPGSIAYAIKNMTQKTITITGKRHANKCQVTCLGSFTSHMQKDSLLEYAASVDCEKVLLVHGEMDGKIQFAEELRDAISKKNKTSKVVVVNKDTEITM